MFSKIQYALSVLSNKSFTRYSDYSDFVLSFPRYAITYLGCRVRQTGLQNLYTPYLYIGHMQVNTLDQVYGRHILRWHNLTSRCTLSCRSDSGAAGGSVIGGCTWPSITFHP